MAHLAETAVFAYMGVDIFSFTGAGISAFFSAHFSTLNASAGADSIDGNTLEPTWHNVDAAANEALPEVGLFVVFALAIVLLARAIVVLPLCVIANCFRVAGRRLSSRMMAMLVFSG